MAWRAARAFKTCLVQWIGLRENLQETIDFPWNMGLSCKISLKPIHWAWWLGWWFHLFFHVRKHSFGMIPDDEKIMGLESEPATWLQVSLVWALRRDSFLGRIALLGGGYAQQACRYINIYIYYIYIEYIYIYYITLIPTQISRQSWTWLCILSKLCHILPMDIWVFGPNILQLAWHVDPLKIETNQPYGYGSIPIKIPFLVGYSHPF